MTRDCAAPRHRDLDRAGQAPAGGYDADGRARDLHGRVIPSRINWLKLIRAVPGLVAGESPAFRRSVPDSFIAYDADDDGTEVTVVACPCGEEPRVPATRCVECSCERFYFAVGGRVLVANSPNDRPPTT